MAYNNPFYKKNWMRNNTSIGANTREAQLSFSEYRAKLACAMLSDWRVNNSLHAQSDADFLSKMQIAHKEADEPMEQREESQACLIYPESGQRKTKSNLLLAFVVA